MDTINLEQGDQLLIEFTNAINGLYKDLNRHRWQALKDREKVFEFKFDDIPNTILPDSTERILLKLNAMDWERQIFRAIRDADFSKLSESQALRYNESFSLSDSVMIQDDSIEQPPSLIMPYEDDLITGDQSVIESTIGKLILSTDGLQLEDDKLGDKLLYIYDTDPSQCITHPSDRVFSISNGDTKSNKRIALVKSLAVSAGTLPVAQIEPEEDDNKFPTVFEDLGLYWEELQIDESTIYLVGTSGYEGSKNTGESKIKQFLNKSKENRTIEDYCELFGLPADTVQYYWGSDWDSAEYDRYSAEEFILYACDERLISDTLMKYILFSLYRPMPTKESAINATFLGKQLHESMGEFKQALWRYPDENPDTLITGLNDIYSDYRNVMWRQKQLPVLPIKTPLVSKDEISSDQIIGSQR